MIRIVDDYPDTLRIGAHDATYLGHTGRFDEVQYYRLTDHELALHYVRFDDGAPTVTTGVTYTDRYLDTTPRQKLADYIADKDWAELGDLPDDFQPESDDTAAATADNTQTTWDDYTGDR